MYNRLVAQPGDNISLGASGGVLLLQPTGHAPGAMSLTDLQNRTWHLLREDGPDTGYAAPTTGDFPIQVVTRDLNIAFADFISQTGLAPGLVERQDTFPVYAVRDYPVPPGLQSLTQIEYNPAGGLSYYLEAVSLNEFVNYQSVILNDQGQPRYYREPFAGYVRLSPVPGLGNAVGPGAGTLTIAGTPQAGQQVTATLQNGTGSPVTTIPFTVQNTDTANTIAFKLSSAINVSAAATGPSAFITPTSPTANVIAITALAMPGTQITVFGTISASGATISPTSAQALSPTGDTMTWYYTAAGNLLVLPGDVPAMPPQFHMALVYRVLSDYWERKQDAGQSDRYMKKFEMAVKRGISYTFDSNRATAPTISEDEQGYGWPEGGG